MYSDLPPVWKWANRSTLGLAWGSGIFAGITALIDTPPSVDATQPLWVLFVWVFFLTFGSGAAFIGVLTGHNRVEEVGAWFGGIGCVSYTLTLWTLVWSGDTDIAAPAWMLTMLFFFILGRAFSCGAHAYRIRKATTDAINTV